MSKNCETIDENGLCGLEVVAKGFCPKHYKRMSNNGTTELLIDSGGVCGVIEEGKPCGKPRNSITPEGLKLCINHAHKYRKWGDPNFDFYRDSEFLLETKPCQIPLTYKDGNPICGRVGKGGSIGICPAHHQRKNKAGDYMTDQPLALVGLSTEERYEIYTDRSEKYIVDEQMFWMDDPCWKWQRVNPVGYGNISSMFNGESLVHRAFYKYHNGPIEPGRTIHHLCGERNCCNSNHLRNWSDWENIDEASRFKYVNTRGKAIEELINISGMTMKELRNKVKELA